MMTFEGASADGSRVFLQSWFSPVVPEDTDGCPDLYERSAGRTTLVSTGPTATPTFPPGTCDLVRFGGLRPTAAGSSSRPTTLWSPGTKATTTSTSAPAAR